jgi:hypothetical protein
MTKAKISHLLIDILSITLLQSLMIRLETTTTTEDVKVRLLETMRKYNEACNFVAERERFP